MPPCYCDHNNCPRGEDPAFPLRFTPESPHRKTHRQALLMITEEPDLDDWSKAVLHAHMKNDLHFALTYMALKDNSQLRLSWIEAFFNHYEAQEEQEGQNEVTLKRAVAKTTKDERLTEEGMTMWLHVLVETRNAEEYFGLDDTPSKPKWGGLDRGEGEEWMRSLMQETLGWSWKEIHDLFVSTKAEDEKAKAEKIAEQQRNSGKEEQNTLPIRAVKK